MPDEDVTEVIAPTTTDDKMLVTDELPSWLSEVEEDQAEALPPFPEEEEGELLPPEPVEAIDDEDLPDWLQEADESGLDEDAFIPEFESAPPSYAVTDSADLAIDEENLPDWLRDVQEEATESAVELPEADQVGPEIDDEDLRKEARSCLPKTILII